MNENSSFTIKMMQTYPMRMSVRMLGGDDLKASFETKLSNNDFLRGGENFIPISFFMELLGQAAELYYRSTGDESKRYLAQVLNFRFNPELFQKLDQVFYTKVEVIQKLGKLYKSHVALSIEDQVLCEGVYVHCNA